MTLQGPDFIIAGAPRSGTTSLYRWLSAHSQVRMADGKELRFFDCNYHKGLGWYRERLPAAGDFLMGEASPRYLTHPHAAQRMSDVIPGVQLIFLLRDPVHRAHSDYMMERARGLGPVALSFEEAIEEPFYRERYLHAGHYAEHLERFEKYFPWKNMHVILFDDLVVQPEATFLAACRFLGVSETLNHEVGRKVNAQVGFRSLRLRRLGRRLPNRLDRLVGRLNVRSAASSSLSSDTEERLREHFASHDSCLQALIGRRLPWAPASDGLSPTFEPGTQTEPQRGASYDGRSEFHQGASRRGPSDRRGSGKRSSSAR